MHVSRNVAAPRHLSPLSLAGCLVVVLLVSSSLFAVERTSLGEAPKNPRAAVATDIASRRTAWVGMAGSRFAAYVDGEAGPKFDEIVSVGGSSFSPNIKLAAETGFAYVGRRSDQYYVVTPDGMGEAYPAAPRQLELSADGRTTVFTIRTDASQPGQTLMINGKAALDGGRVDELRVSNTGRYVACRFIPDETDAASETFGKLRGVIFDGGDKVAEYRLPGSMEMIAFAEDDSHYAYVEQVLSLVEVEHNGKKGHQQVLTYRVVRDGEPGPDYPAVLRLEMSPDGERLAYFVSKDEQQLRFATHLVVDGKEIELKSTLSMPQYGKGPWHFFSDDLAHFAYMAQVGKGQTFVVDGRSGFEYQSVANFTFSPDGKRFAYTAMQGGKAYVIVDDEESDGYRQITTPPAFTADGSHCVYVAQDDGGEHHVVVDDKTVARYGHFRKLVFSPAGSRFAVLGYADNINSIYLDGKTIDLDKGMNAMGMAFSPDGKRFAYITNHYTSQHNSQLVVDGQKWPVYQGGQETTPIFSPDGSDIAYLAVHHLVLNGEKCPGERNLVLAGHNQPPTWTFTDDGHLQYYTVEDGQFYRYRIKGKGGAATAAQAKDTAEPAKQTASQPVKKSDEPASPAKEKPAYVDPEQEAKETVKQAEEAAEKKKKDADDEAADEINKASKGRSGA